MTYQFNCTLPEEILEPIAREGLDTLPEMIRTIMPPDNLTAASSKCSAYERAGQRQNICSSACFPHSLLKTPRRRRIDADKDGRIIHCLQ